MGEDLRCLHGQAGRHVPHLPLLEDNLVLQPGHAFRTDPRLTATLKPYDTEIPAETYGPSNAPATSFWSQSSSRHGIGCESQSNFGVNLHARAATSLLETSTNLMGCSIFELNNEPNEVDIRSGRFGAPTAEGGPTPSAPNGATSATAHCSTTCTPGSPLGAGHDAGLRLAGLPDPGE